MRSVAVLLLLVGVAAGALSDILSKDDLAVLAKYSPENVKDAWKALTIEDKLSLYNAAVNGHLLPTLLTGNERLAHFSSTVFTVLMERIAKLHGNAKIFAQLTVKKLAELHWHAHLDEDLHFDELASEEAERFKKLTDQEKHELAEQFPLLYKTGVFENKRFRNMVERIAEAKRKHEEL